MSLNIPEWDKLSRNEHETRRVICKVARHE
jgi:hypothetical protein